MPIRAFLAGTIKEQRLNRVLCILSYVAAFCNKNIRKKKQTFLVLLYVQKRRVRDQKLRVRYQNVTLYKTSHREKERGKRCD